MGEASWQHARSTRWIGGGGMVQRPQSCPCFQRTRASYLGLFKCQDIMWLNLALLIKLLDVRFEDHVKDYSEIVLKYQNLAALDLKVSELILRKDLL